jgi:hypothetical protein
MRIPMYPLVKISFDKMLTRVRISQQPVFAEL